MAVTHVIRGEDHISNTPRQVLLYEAFGWTPPLFAHLSLVLGPDHAPLSKRHGATSVAEFRDKGYLPEALVNYLALIGWSPRSSKFKVQSSKLLAAGEDAAEELLPADELARRFRLEDVSHSAGVFDEDKLAWVNRHYLKTIPPERLVTEALPFLRQAGIVVGELDAAARTWLEKVLPPTAASVDRLNQLADRLRTVFEFSAAAIFADEALGRELMAPGPRSVVMGLAEELAGGGPLWDRETFRAAANRVKDRTGQKGKALFHPIRAALTGAAEGPELDIVVPAIEHAAALPAGSGLAPVIGCHERVRALAAHLATRDS
jgi:nondiscriminating glutamyl-tRNA synthetase